MLSAAEMRRALITVALSVLGVGCRRPTDLPSLDAGVPANVSETERSPVDAITDASTELAPLEGEWIERWTMPSGAVVFVTRPQGATRARPIVIAVHGAEDHADWACSEWRATVGGFAWVLCPQGVPLRSGYAWSSAEMIAARAFEARDMLQARYGPYVAPGPLLYGGFSQGATLASSVVSTHPGQFDRVVMVEAGHTPLSPSGVIFGLKKGQVGMATISCSTGGCAAFSSELLMAARNASFDLLTNDGGRRGHVFDGVTIKSLGDTLVKMVAADPRFEGLANAVHGGP
jgi:pimeloyl-ACP methyl ester carboxylesterase